MTHKEYADSLRKIADWFQLHEEIALPHDADTFDYFSANTKEEMATVARALGSCKKEVNEASQLFHLTKQFGFVTFRAIAYRERVCERIVVGKRYVPSRIVEAAKERIIPEHEEEIVTWRCEPLLAEGQR